MLFEVVVLSSTIFYQSSLLQANLGDKSYIFGFGKIQFDSIMVQKLNKLE